MILPNTDPDDVPMLLERIGSSQLGDRPCPPFSYGVAQCPAEADDIDEPVQARRLPPLRSEEGAPVNVDDLELELRKLPGVRTAGFTDRDDVLLIQLQVSGETRRSNLPLQATRIAYRHSEKPVALEVVRWRVSPEPATTPTVGTSPLDGALGSRAGDRAARPEPALRAGATEPELDR